MATTGNCGLCQEPANQEMLTCSRCASQFHCTCCGSENSATSSSWMCETCRHVCDEGEHNLETESHFKVNHPGNKDQHVEDEAMPEDQQILLQQLEDEMCLEREYLRRKYALLNPRVQSNGEAKDHPQHAAGIHRYIMMTNDSATNTPQATSTRAQSMPCKTNGITPQQVAARQSMPRELPVFKGDPREWPLFISTYETSTRIGGYSNEENAMRLQRCLKGRALEAVRDSLLFPEMLPSVISTLRMYFGRPEHIIKLLMENVRNLPPPKGKLEPLIEFAFAVKNMCATIRASKLDAHLNNPTLLQELIEKTGPDMMLNWALHSKSIPYPNIQHLADWLFELAEAASRVSTPNILLESDKKRINRGVMHTHTAAPTDSPKNTCLKNHKGSCWSRVACDINGCKAKHHRLLHKDVTESVLHNHRGSLTNQPECYVRIVPVTLHSNSKSVDIYAFMDDGSTLTLVEEKLADALEVKGFANPLCIRWTGDVSRQEPESKQLNLKISKQGLGNKLFKVNEVCTVKSIGLSAETMIADRIKQRYPHLKNLPIPSFINAMPQMIIGSNNPNLIASLKVREGKWQQPIAAKTRLGWTIYGGSGRSGGGLNLHRCQCDLDLHEMVKKHLLTEEKSPPIFTKSPDEERSLQILEDTVSYSSRTYTTGLLWKDGPRVFPNSLPVAKRRLLCMQKKMAADPPFANELHNQIQNLIAKGYARKLPEEEIREKPENAWYLPIFTVRNPHKPDRVRLVWDAAAQSSGVALNDFLLKGPDLLVPLLQIMYNFRMKAIGVSGDIAEMFHRIAVREEDAKAQRFLWQNQTTGVVETFQLNVLTFGATCSPCIAHYVRDLNAKKHADEFPAAAKAIQSSHYVDDYIDSCHSEEEAITLAKEVREVHARGGFHMRKWCSNSKRVLAALCDTTTYDEKQFFNSEEIHSYEKILGMRWSPHQDAFTYALKFVRLKRNIIATKVAPTKREILQVLMSVFDPMGFVSCIMMYLKILLQQVWRSKIDWDEEIPPNLQDMWQSWLSFLPLIENVRIPRCYFKNWHAKDCRVQIHVFVDAGEDAYSAVAYFRIEQNNQILLSLVSAKSKVAPLQPLSIPRLELQAAVTGARLMKNIIAQHEIDFEECYLWTDSKTVLAWLIGDPRRYQQYVMFRIAEICELTDARNWRWVPSKLNVADIATKRQHRLETYTQWFEGPKFLKLPPADWPTETTNERTATEELRPRFLHMRRESSTQPSKTATTFAGAVHYGGYNSF
ncbi:uncharacterized protein [Drosophila tropicalis]|uniref:uncharacterized protein n=1 Tax=Drosophila tropicalis TaxID=46794 RepID=UPI0035AC0946